MSDKVNWKLVGAAAAGLLVVAAGLYFVLSPAEEVEEETGANEANSGAGAPPAAPAQASGSSKPAAEPAARREAAPAKAAAAAAPAAAEKAKTISKEQLKKVLQQMVDKLMALKDEMERERTRMMLAGASADDVEEMGQTMLQEGMARVEEEIATQNNVDQTAVMHAQQQYSEDEDVAPLVGQLRAIFFGDEQLAEMQEAAAAVPNDMTPDRFMTHLTRHVQVVNDRFASVLRKAAEQTAAAGATGDERAMYAEMLIQRELQSIMEEAQEACGLPEPVWKGCLVKYGSHPDVITMLMESAQKQKELRDQLLGTS